MEIQKALIYKLTCNVTNKVYYGSTTKTISHRISRHKTSFRAGRNCRSKEIIENWDYKTEVLEEVDLENRFERESYYIKNFACVNKVIPCRTKKQYTIDNKDNKKEYDKKYREDNKEKINNQKKEYYEKNKDQIYEKNKEYREKNKEKIKLKKHIDYLNSK